MGKPLIVKLDTLYGRDDSVELVKSIDSDYENKTFGEIISYMTNPEPDGVNEEYNAAEKELAERITNWLDEARGSSNISVSIKALSKNGLLVDGISLDDKIKSYSNEIILDGSEIIDGKNIPYSYMELYIRKDNNGG